jgi:hypothetical protein
MGSGPAYSKRFLTIAYTATSASAVVPAGKVWVIKNVAAFDAGANAADAVAFAVAGLNYAYWTGAVSGAGRSQSWNGMLVARAGETISLSSSGTGGWNVAVSGYELTA